MKIFIRGEIRLKKQKGRYSSVGTPNMRACVAPQVFQGTSTEVTVPESSKARLRTSGFSPLCS